MYRGGYFEMAEALQDPPYLLLTLLHPPERNSGTDDRILPCYSSLLPGDWALHPEKAQAQGMDGAVGAGG